MAKQAEAISKKAEGPKAGVARNTWTDQQVALLRAEMPKHKTATAAFEAVAPVLNKSVGTIRQKWYSLNGSAKGKRTRSTTPRAVRVPRETMADTVRSLSSDELVQLAKAVQSEVRHRQVELEAAGNLFA